VDRKKVNFEVVKSSNLPIIWVLGGPGSGKGTQCNKLVTRHGFTHLSSGDLLRNEVLSDSKIGRQLYVLMENGELVPSTVVLDLLAEAMEKEINGGKAKGFVLDSFPINLEQAETFESFVSPPTKIVYLATKQHVMVDRLRARGNFDDFKDAIDKRCDTFKKKTLAVLKKYDDKVVKVDADQPDQKVAEDIEAKAGL